VKWFVTFVVASTILWIVIAASFGAPCLQQIANLKLGDTPLFIHNEEEAGTAVKWMLIFSGLFAAGLGAEIANIVCDWERFIERLLVPRKRRHY
jgi:hypothetical protein